MPVTVVFDAVTVRDDLQKSHFERGMGFLLNGVWQEKETEPKTVSGNRPSSYRSWVTKDGSPGPTGSGGFKAEAGRYHLYVNYVCPFAHRTLIMHHLKGLKDIVSVSVTHFVNGEQGWTFQEGPGLTPDHLFGSKCLHEVR